GGIATFNTLTIGKAGSGYTLTAADGSLTGATSNSFNILAGTAAQLVFTAQPTNTTAGQIIDGASGVQVAVEDSAGNFMSTDSSSVTIAIGAGSPSTTLHGTLTVAASGGIATFNTLTIAKAGTGYTLTAADAGLTGATSNSFNILAGT